MAAKAYNKLMPVQEFESKDIGEELKKRFSIVIVTMRAIPFHRF